MASGLEGLPETIGRYEVRGLLGRGGMGRVIAGHDPVLRRNVAIKLVEPTAVSVEDLAELRFMFHREARATAALRHPNIVEVYDYSGPDEDLVFIAIELIHGETLAEVVTRRGAISAREVAALGYELAVALEAAHAEGIVHRDLKPDNVFWDPTGRVVLSDFGIAKAFDGSNRLGGTIQFGGTSLYGSPSYIAPEQLLGDEISHLTDLYALGTVLYECLTGQQVYGGTDIKDILDAVITGDHVPVTELVAPPPGLARLIEALLSTETRSRPASARQVAGALRTVLDDLGVSDPRICLRDQGDETAIDIHPAPKEDRVDVAGDPEEEEEEEHRLFEPQPLQVIHVPIPTSFWGRATRGPTLLGMIAMAVVLVAGVQLARSLAEDPEDDPSAPTTSGSELEPTVTTDAGRLPSTADASDVFVLLELEGRQTVFIDGIEVGTWNDRVRLALPPGRHTFEARSAEGGVKREVMLIKGTQPEFELYE